MRITAIAFSLGLLAAACSSGNKQPASTTPEPAPAQPAEPTPTDPAQTGTVEPMAPETCTQQGGEVRGDIGDGKVACADGEKELGKVKTGVEGGVCCSK